MVMFILLRLRGENAKGKDKNIDDYAPLKYEAIESLSLKVSSERCFVRDIAGTLRYLNEGEWRDDIANWHPIDELFGF